MRFLLDTNVISELRKGARCQRAVAAWQAGVALTSQFISVISLFEIRLGIAFKQQKDPEAGRLLLEWYEKRLRPAFAGRTLALDAGAAERAALMNIPATRPFRDCLIAATAAEHDLVIATGNEKDFRPLGAALVNPWKP